MRPVVEYPDVERLLVDHLADVLTGACGGGVSPTVGVGVPVGWSAASVPHVEVALDGTPEHAHPVAVYPTVRVVAHTSTASRAKALAGRALGELCADPWPTGVSLVQLLTGVFPARDPDTGAEVASFTVRVTVRSSTELTSSV